MSAVVVPQVAVRIDLVADPLLEHFGLGEATVRLALPDLHGATKTPPVPGTRETLPKSSPKVLSSSWASQAARNSHWHCVQ